MRFICVIFLFILLNIIYSKSFILLALYANTKTTIDLSDKFKNIISPIMIIINPFIFTDLTFNFRLNIKIIKFL